jgi:iron complex outermembrane receptor protein
LFSAARAVRTSSRFDTDLYATGTFAGGPNFISEDLLALEAGYRAQPAADLSFSISTYFNIYDDLRTVEASGPAVVPLVVKNGMRGNTYGVEAWGRYAPRDWLRLKAGVSAIRKELHLVSGSRDIFGVAFAGNDPSYQFQFQSDIDLPGDVALNFGLRSIDRLASPAVPSYVEADAKIDWRVVEGLHISLAGVNLFHPRHVEFINGSLPALAVPRSVYLEAGLQF